MSLIPTVARSALVHALNRQGRHEEVEALSREAPAAQLSQGATVVLRSNLAAVGAMGLASAPALAAGQATNIVHQYLTGHPRWGLPQSCHSWSIYRAPGKYRWDPHTVGDTSDNASRTIYLAAGTYKWNDCITPQNGSYNQFSQLTPPSGPGPKVATLAIDEGIPFLGNAYYNWASTLSGS